MGAPQSLPVFSHGLWLSWMLEGPPSEEKGPFISRFVAFITGKVH